MLYCINDIDDDDDDKVTEYVAITAKVSSIFTFVFFIDYLLFVP